MIKYLKLAFLINVSVVALSLASDANTNKYSLDEKTIESAKIKSIDVTPSTNDSIKKEDIKNIFDVQKEKIPGGYIEKLLTKDGIVVAEKKVINNEVTDRTLYEYHQNGNLSRKVISFENTEGFFAEEYYSNGKKSSNATYLNNQNKIGIEKKYDIYGVLRQEIPWVEVEPQRNKKSSQRTSTIKGQVNTYYPSGKIAASFSVGKKGKNVFFNENGKIIHEIQNAEILNFKPEINQEDCANMVIELTLGELVELYEDEGDISYNKCGMPYKEVFVYEINNTVGINNTKLSFDENGMLRRITTYKHGKKEGIERKYDGDGNLTAEVPYSNGIKNGIANGYFPTRELAFRKRYENGKVTGNLNCYFPSGKLAAEIPYVDGNKDGKAKIYSPQDTIIEFKQGKQLTKENNKRKHISYKNAIINNNEQCLDFAEYEKNLMLDLKAKEESLKKGLNISPIKECEDLSKYQIANNILACYVNNKIRAYYPPAYAKGKFAILTLNDENAQNTDSIQYNKKLRNGIARSYNKDNIIKELSYNDGDLSETSRVFYANGTVKDLFSLSEDKKYELLNSYNEDGSLNFSLSYKNGKKDQTFMSTDENDVYIKFYNDKPENIRQVNKLNPLNFIEYNLAIGEYIVHKDESIIKIGKICGHDTISPDIEIIDYMPLKTQEPISEINNEEIPPIINSKDAPYIEDISKNKEETTAINTQEPQLEENDTIAINDPLSIEANDAMYSIALEELEREMEALKQEHEKLTKEASLIDIDETKEKAPVETKEKASVKKLEEITTLKENSVNNIIEEVGELSVNLNTAPQKVIKKPTQIEYNVENAIIPSAKEKKDKELASKNIGPITKPDINDLSEVVSKEHVDNTDAKKLENLEIKTEKFYYPNGNLRKTVKTKGLRTEEIKEYSKTGLLHTDTMYNDDGILIEKYYGSGEIRRKIQKAYTDNVIMAFVSRLDFFNSGKIRYEIKRKEDTLLFEDKEFYPNGILKKETLQTSPIVFVEKNYDKDGKLSSEYNIVGLNTLHKEYDKENNVQKMLLNNKEVPITMAKDSQKLLDDSSKTYHKNGKIASEFIIEKKSNIIKEYYNNGALKTEIVFYNNGEISVKSYTKDSALDKFAYLSPDGKLHIQKPEVRTIPSYRERYWVDYNNPKWIENQDKYSIKSIGELNLDTVAYILTELEIEIPEIIKTIYSLYQK